MVTLERTKEGIAAYIDREIIAKIHGAKKWMVALAVPSIFVRIDEMVEKNRDILIKSGYLTEDCMVDIDKIHEELRLIASKTGAVTEHFPLVGDVMFSISDIDCLRSWILGS